METVRHHGRETAATGLGTTIYTDSDETVGRIHGFDENGFSVTLCDGIEGISVEHVRSGQQFGEAELVWRCWERGECGRIDRDIPDECPSRGTERENRYYRIED